MKIRSIKYNWHQVGAINDHAGCGEDYSICEVGAPREGKIVVHIVEHFPTSGNQLHHYDVMFDDGSVKRIFNPNTVEYFVPKTSEE